MINDIKILENINMLSRHTKANFDWLSISGYLHRTFSLRLRSHFPSRVERRFLNRHPT